MLLRLYLPCVGRSSMCQKASRKVGGLAPTHFSLGIWVLYSIRFAEDVRKLAGLKHVKTSYEQGLIMSKRPLNRGLYCVLMLQNVLCPMNRGLYCLLTLHNHNKGCRDIRPFGLQWYFSFIQLTLLLVVFVFFQTILYNSCAYVKCTRYNYLIRNECILAYLVGVEVPFVT